MSREFITPSPFNPQAESASSVDATPAHVYVWGDSAAGFKIDQPLRVTVSHTEDGYLFSDDLFNCYGEGATWDEAQRDFVGSLIDYYFLMSVSPEAATQEIVRHLESYIRRV